MRYYLLIAVLICLISRTIARPPRLDQSFDREVEEEEYQNNEENLADNSFEENEEANVNEQESRDAELFEDEEPARDDTKARGPQFNKEKYMSHVLADERAEKPINDNLMEYSRKTKEEKVDEDASPNIEPLLQKWKQSNKYTENDYTSNVPESTPNIIITENRDEDSLQDDAHNNEFDERTMDSRKIPLDDSDSLYDDQKTHRRNVGIDNHKSNSGPNEPRHSRQYSNVINSDYRVMSDKSSANRDRRQAELRDTLGSSSSSTEKVSLFFDTVNDDDEAAIKRHIKKLSEEELEELLNSLSDEKKALLNKIMDNNQNYDSLNKREITKKAGASEENNYIESGLSEASKLQSVSSSVDMNTESAGVQSSDTKNTKEVQTETSDVSSTNVPETSRGEESENKAKLTDEVTNANSNLIANEDSGNILLSDSQSVKSDCKRQASYNYQDEPIDETRLSDDYLNVEDSGEPLNDQDRSYVSQENDLTQLIDDEPEIHRNQEFKREILLEDPTAKLDDSIRTLEESFPKSNCEESGQYLESNMAPLIRVKRTDKNHEIQKRAAISPDDKVAYIPNKAENEDEDNNEGNEFNDDGFYDRNANYEKSNMNRHDTDPALTDFAVDPHHLYDKERTKSERTSDKMNSETMSLGSDTDSVLSGIEGVDDNLMYSAGTRNKRNLEENLELLTEKENSTPVRDDYVKSSENYINIPHYHENDAFGALPHSYEGDLGRYKRIRRVKPSLEVNSDC